MEKDNWEIESRYESNYDIIASKLYYERKELETLKEKILQDFCDLACKVENNVCYASYDEIQEIIDKRFGF